MNLRAIDLNLLVILDALLEEAHVSRAAHRLGLTQPAVSAALQRLRGLFGDVLLERGRGTMRRTARAEALRAPLKALLTGVHQLVDPPDIPLAEIRQSTRFVVTDHVASLLLPRLLRRLAETAPGIDLILKPWRGYDHATLEMLNGELDLALSVFEREQAGIERQLVLMEQFVVAMRSDHPALPGFDLERWLAYRHVVVSGQGDRYGVLDEALKPFGRTRHVGLVVPNFQCVPAVLKETDLIAMLPAHSLSGETGEGLAVLPTAIPIPGFPVHLAWPVRIGSDKALRHVAAIVAELLALEIAPMTENCGALAAD